MKPYYLFLLIAFISCKKDRAVEPGTVDDYFEKYFGTSNDEFCSGGAVLNDFIYVSGWTDNTLPDNGDMLLYKLDRTGEEVWKKQFGFSSLQEEATGVKVVSGNQLILFGKTLVPGNAPDAYVLKLNENGDELWNVTFGGAAKDFIWDILELPSGNIMCIGVTESYGAGSLDQYLVILDQNGLVISEKTFGALDVDGGSRLALMESGNIMIYGHTRNYSAIDRDLQLIKVNQLGDSLWSKVFYDLNYQESQGFINSQDGGFLYCAHSSSVDPMHQMLIRKTDTLGAVLWEDHIGGVSHDGGEDVLELTSGNVLFLGRTESYGAGGQDIMVNLSNSSGVILDQFIIGGAGDDLAKKIVQIDDSFFVLGHSNSSGAGGYDIFVVKQEF